MEYYQIDPFGNERADLQAGIIASTMANAHSKGKTFKPSDFMADFEKPERPQTNEEGFAVFMAALNQARVARGMEPVK